MNYISKKGLLYLNHSSYKHSGYLDFAERQAEREIPMTMEDWAKHLDGILTSTGEDLLIGNRTVSHCRRWKRLKRNIRNTKQKHLAVWKRIIWKV
ncbi:RhuM family protein [Holdemania filiformis]|nr:RhuM family protein [Holdemania filiformis]MCQ4952897.1 virulence RhuM family protein [Holdemania filiformis]